MDGTGLGLYPVVGFIISIAELVVFWYSKVIRDLLSASDGNCINCLWFHGQMKCCIYVTVWFLLVNSVNEPKTD